jgi:arabinofuranosyltransferase
MTQTHARSLLESGTVQADAVSARAKKSRWGPPILHFGVAALVLLVWSSLFGTFVFDDSYIAFRFSANWAAGNGLRWNPGEDPVEGFTSFAWVLIGAVCQRALGIPPHVSMVFVGITCWFVLVAWLFPRMLKILINSVHTHTRTSLRLITLCTALMVAINPYLGLNAFHGLETPLQILAFAAVAYCSLKNVTTKNEVELAAVAFFSYMVRPDALAFVLPLYVLRFIYCDSRDERRGVIVGFITIGVTIAIYSIVKWRWFGFPLPNTFYIKQGGLFSGFWYVKNYLTVLAGIWLFLVFAAGRAGVLCLLKDRPFVLLLFPSIAFCLAYVKLNPILGEGYRFLIPTFPLIAAACLRSYILAEGRFSEYKIRGWKVSIPTDTFAVYLLAIASSTAVFGSQMYREYSGLRAYFKAIEQTLIPAGHNLAKMRALSPPPLLATGDIGAMPYFSQLPTMDIIGLADETVAHSGLTHEYIALRKPDLLVLQDLYLVRTSPNEATLSEPYSDVTIAIDGSSYKLDLAKYKGVLDAPERAHSGAGSTFQVVTTPGFESNYVYVMNWDFGNLDRYHVFVRSDYAHSSELVEILRQSRHNVGISPR